MGFLGGSLESLGEFLKGLCGDPEECWGRLGGPWEVPRGSLGRLLGGLGMSWGLSWGSQGSRGPWGCLGNPWEVPGVLGGIGKSETPWEVLRSLRDAQGSPMGAHGGVQRPWVSSGWYLGEAIDANSNGKTQQILRMRSTLFCFNLFM